ncbi:MAG: hypothetical protein JSV96_06165 [Candidatus Aminicenantes bacterium]|nr:MAG: hypothetical protein JSV96_06165 [Candidatus Aminicenantes bacterium]
MRRLHFILGMYIFFTAGICSGQINYPFLDTEANRDIQAYWYNVPQASVDSGVAGTMDIQSALHVYGMMPADLFQVEVEVYYKKGKLVFKKKFEVNKAEKSDFVQFKDGFFKLIQPVECLEENPEKVTVIITSDGEKRKKEIRCRYHKLFGRLTDFEGDPVEGFVFVCPDAFARSKLGVITDKNGNYEVVLPERTYNSIIANTAQYGISRLEAWAWHIIIDGEQQLDFKIGNGEVYNLNVWANTYKRSYLISFRPMELFLGMKNENTTVHLNGRDFQIGVWISELEISDVQVTINGKDAEILSFQKYYETQSSNAGCIAYIIQVKRSDEHGFTGKQTVMVSYEKTVEMGGKKRVVNSVGYYQLYLNFTGLTKYY